MKKSKKLRYAATQRQIELKLTEKEYNDLIELGCTYCGDEVKTKGGYSLDRLDSNKGYTFDNVVPCCKICNVAKNNMELGDFFAWIDRVYNFKQKQLEAVASLRWTGKDFKKAENQYLNSQSNRNSELI